MLKYIRTNHQFLILVALWVGVGVYLGPIPAIILTLLSVLLFKYKNLYQELFLGFILVLILSDSRQKGLVFASDVKTFYILLLSAFFIFDKKNFPPFNKLFYFFVPFLLLSVFLIPKSEIWVDCTQKTISYILLLLIIPNYVIKIYEERGIVFLKNMILMLTIVLLSGFVLKVLDSKIVVFQGRYSGVFGNPNGIGLFSSIFFLLFSTISHYFPYLFSKKEKYFILSVIFITIILCASRNAIMTVLIFLLFRRLYKLSPFWGFVIFLVIVVSYQLIFLNIESIISQLGLGEYFRISTLKTGSGRNIAWEFAWKKIQDNFFLGKGFAHDIVVFYGGENQNVLNLMGHQGNAHNSFLTLWLATGVIGLFLFMRGFFLAFLKGSKNTRIAIPLMYTILFSANLESWIAASLNPFTIQIWIILTLLTAEQFNNKEHENFIPIH